MWNFKKDFMERKVVRRGRGLSDRDLVELYFKSIRGSHIKGTMFFSLFLIFFWVLYISFVPKWIFWVTLVVSFFGFVHGIRFSHYEVVKALKQELKNRGLWE